MATTTAAPAQRNTAVVKLMGLSLVVLPTISLGLYVLKQGSPPASESLSKAWTALMILLLIPSYAVPTVIIVSKGDRGYALTKAALLVLALAYGGLAMVAMRFMKFDAHGNAVKDLSTLVMGWVMTAGLVTMHMLLMAPPGGGRTTVAAAPGGAVTGASAGQVGSQDLRAAIQAKIAGRSGH